MTGPEREVIVMELIERYLQAIGRFLPAGQRADILAELRSELEEQIDARAAEWGRPLDEADVAALLKVQGKPETVATRYLPQRSLIGPGTFPMYRYALQWVLPVVAVVYAIGEAAAMLFSPPQHDIARHIFGAIFGVVPSLFISWGLVTIAFAIFEYAHRQPLVCASLDCWNPYKLPGLRPQGVKEKSFNLRLFELALHVLWMLYVLAIPTHLFLVIGPAAQAMKWNGIALGPVWGGFYAMLLAILSVQLLMRILALRSSPQPWLPGINLATSVIGVVGVSLLAFGQPILIATSATMDPLKLAALNHGLSLAFRLILILGIFGFFAELWRYLRRPGLPRRRPLAA